MDLESISFFVSLVAVAGVGYFTLLMNQALYRKWLVIRIGWELLDDFRKLRDLAHISDSVAVQRRCAYIVRGLGVSFGVFVLATCVFAILIACV